jgi:hypothetical protein
MIICIPLQPANEEEEEMVRRKKREIKKRCENKKE